MLLKSAKLCDFFAYQKFNKNLFSSGNRIMEVESVCVCVYEFRNISCQFKWMSRWLVSKFISNMEEEAIIGG